MTNFEYYKDAILDITTPNPCMAKGLDELGMVYAMETKFLGNDKYYLRDLFIWGCQEHATYKLTEFEKKVLENLKEEYKYIQKYLGHIMLYNRKGSKCYVLGKIFDNIDFNALEEEKEYEVKDILANCEVI